LLRNKKKIEENSQKFKEEEKTLKKKV